MATIDYLHGNGAYASPIATFDITSVVAERIGPYVYYFSFDTDGTMFVLHSQGGMITGWSHMAGATTLQTGTTSLALQPFLDILGSRNPSSAKAMAYVFGTDDVLNGSNARDEMAAGAGADRLNGGGGNDHLLGGTGTDVLTGGAGADRLTGGADADQFVFDMASEGVDRITDFAVGSDKIALSGLAFGLSGPLVAGESFVTGAATAAAATVIYDQATGVLSLDADGTGAGSAVALAVLGNHAALTAGDFLVF